MSLVILQYMLKYARGKNLYIAMLANTLRGITQHT